MSSKDSLVSPLATEIPSESGTDSDSEMKSHMKSRSRLPWYYAPAFLLFWFVLFFAVVLPVFFYLPDGLRVDNEPTEHGQFIAERAERILFDFEIIGPKVVGSFANENQTVQLLYDELEKIQRAMHHDLFKLEIDLQQVSGAYLHWSMVNMYQAIQNFVVKVTPKNTTSESYLLINSHFDSKPGSPGTGDDGAMVVVMLEVLRVLVTTRQTFEHPIVFLFNGAEENPLQASHAFITQHKWAKNCKALINLDSAGSGHREILFQSGPNHPWLVNYYRKHVKRPYATTVAEELFQGGVIPSDTDFRIFRDYGHLPGLDLAHVYNGYVYHTKYDKFNVIPRGTLQTTGNHVLALARAFANSTELRDPSLHADGNVVFYDYLNQFLVFYTETQGKIINTVIAVVTLVLVGLSLWRMAALSFVSIGNVARLFSVIFGLHVVSFVLGFALPILMALLFDGTGRPMTWFANKWLVFGLFVCPSLFGLSAPTLLYLSFSRNDKLSKPFRLQMVLHAHSILLALLCIVFTYLGVRSTYVLMMSLFFYAIALLLNLVTTLHQRRNFWVIFLVISQIMPFLYFAYLSHAFLCVMTPMMGRNGTTTNSDMFIAVICSLGTVLAMGFLIPLLNVFRKPKTILLSLLVITFIFAMVAITPIGFPYRAETNVGRVNYLQVQRVLYDSNGSVIRNESGFLFDFGDRFMQKHLEEDLKIGKFESITEECDKALMCSLPIFNHRMYKVRKLSRWLPSKENFTMPEPTTELTVINRTVNETDRTIKYEFELSGPTHRGIFIQPCEGATVEDWSFIRNMLDNPQEWQPPYQIYFSAGKDQSPLKFFVTFKKSDGKYDEPIVQMGISGHYINFDYERDELNRELQRKFPDYIFVMEWPSSYQQFIF